MPDPSVQYVVVKFDDKEDYYREGTVGEYQPNGKDAFTVWFQQPYWSDVPNLFRTKTVRVYDSVSEELMNTGFLYQLQYAEFYNATLPCFTLRLGCRIIGGDEAYGHKSHEVVEEEPRDCE